jgi:PAS domain S-box-containing protein
MNFVLVKPRSLKTRVTGIALLVFLAGFLSLSLYVTWELRRDLQKQMGAQQLSIVTLLAEQIDDELEQRMAMLQRVARDVTPSQLARPADLQALLEQRPVLHSFFNGGVIAYLPTGVAVAEVPLSAGRVGVNYMDIDTIAAALKEGRSTFGRPVMGKKLSAPEFGVTVPIRDARGTVVGALRGVVNLALPNFLDRIFENRYGKTGGYILVAPAHRLVVTATDKHLALRDLPANAVDPLVNRFMDGFEGSGVATNLAGVEVLVSARRIPIASWYIAGALPTTEAFEAIRNLQKRMALVTGAFALLVTGLAWWSIRRVLDPVLSASKTLAKVVGVSEHAQPAALKHGDELSEVLQTTTQLVRTLEQRDAALRASETVFRGIFENSGTGIAQTDVDGQVIRFNEAFRAMLGYDADALLAMRYTDFTHMDALSPEATLFNEMLAGQRTHYRLIKRYLPRDGRLLWVDISVSADRDAQGTVTSLIAVVTDVTDSQQIRALRTSEAFQQAILNALPAEVAVVDPQGVIRAVNGTWVRFAQDNADAKGYSPTRSGVGASYLMAAMAGAAQGAAMAQEAVEGIRAVMERRQPGFSLVYACHAPHQPRWFTMYVLPLVAGADEGVVITHTDITELKLTEQALLVARDEAERANRAKSNFLASMSHELRTPLNSILGFAQIMKYDATLPQAHMDNVQEILGAGHYLLQLINEILDLAKIESGRTALAMEPVEVGTVVHECLHLVAGAADTRHIALAYEPLPGAALRADRTRLRQVLLNLLSNAIKYNAVGGSVRVQLQEATPGCLRVVVQDTGAGIAAERLGELFLPFSRLGAEGSGIEGTGIGLSIARRLAEMMGGTVGVESTVGVGSRFWIELTRETLPDPVTVPGPETMRVSAAAADPANVLLADEAPVPDPDGAPRRVLYIEDNLVNLRLVAKILARRPHIEVITAETPAQGIALALAHHPDLILLDINMPGMDGFAVLQVLKSDPGLAGIPVVAVTANAMASDIERGRAAGFSDYLTKPLDVLRFNAVVDHWLSAGVATPSPR